LVRECPWLSEVSGHRSEERNREVGGSDASKHLLGMARDFAAPDKESLRQGELAAEALGLWATVHDAGSGWHLHIQGLAPGSVPGWWLDKGYGGKHGRY
jgi:hypothetical protein